MQAIFEINREFGKLTSEYPKEVLNMHHACVAEWANRNQDDFDDLIYQIGG
jgi:hypothetical protein